MALVDVFAKLTYWKLTISTCIAYVEVYPLYNLFHTLRMRKIPFQLGNTIEIYRGLWLHGQAHCAIEQCELEANARKQLSQAATDV
jgi:hypothetical protein